MGLTKREKRQRERQRDAEAGGKGQTEREKARDIREGKEEKKKETRQKPVAVQPSPAIDLRAMEKGKVMKPGETAPIKSEKPKTGISKLREEDSIIGKAVRVATDWKTTVALVATLGTVITFGSGFGVTAGARAAAGTGRAVITRTATTISKHPTTMTTQRAIVGKPAVSSISKLFNAGAKFQGVKLAANAKTHALTTSLLTKAGMTLGAASFWAGSVFMGKWGSAEGPEAIEIVMRDAYKQAQQTGDWQIYWDAVEVRDELLNLEAWENVALWSPFSAFVGIPIKVKGVKEAALLLDKVAEKEQQKQEEEEEELTFEEERVAGEERARERELGRREEDEEYWEKQREESAERKAEERLADEKYWEEIYKRNQKRKADEREADEAYWAKIKGAALDDEDRRIIDDWNKGRSALNFKWLGM